MTTILTAAIYAGRNDGNRALRDYARWEYGNPEARWLLALAHRRRGRKPRRRRRVLR